MVNKAIRWIARRRNGIIGVVAVGTAAASSFVTPFMSVRNDEILIIATGVILGLLVQHWLVAGCAFVAYVSGFYLSIVVFAPRWLAAVVVNEPGSLIWITLAIGMFIVSLRLVLVVFIALLVMSLKMTGLAGYRKLRERTQA